MNDFVHRLRLQHHRSDLTPEFGRPSAEGEVEVTSTSSDLTEAWREMLSRLPNDVYAALKAAMPAPDPSDDPEPPRPMRCPRCGRESMGRKGDVHVHAGDDGAFYLDPSGDDAA